MCAGNRSFGAVTNRTAGLSAGSDGGKTDGTNALVSWSLSEIRVNDLRTLEFMVCAKLQSPMDGRVASGNLAFHRKAVFIVYNRYDVASNYLNVGSRSDFFSHQEVQVKVSQHVVHGVVLLVLCGCVVAWLA